MFQTPSQCPFASDGFDRVSSFLHKPVDGISESASESPTDFGIDPKRRILESCLLGFAQFLDRQTLHARHASGSVNAHWIGEDNYQRLATRIWKKHHQPTDQITAEFYEPLIKTFGQIEILIRSDANSISATDKAEILRKLAQRCMQRPEKAIFYALDAQDALQVQPQSLTSLVTEASSTLNNLFYAHRLAKFPYCRNSSAAVTEAIWNYSTLKSAVPELKLSALFEQHHDPEISTVLLWLEKEISPAAPAVTSNLGWLSLKIAQVFRQQALQLIRERQEWDPNCLAKIVHTLKQRFGSAAALWWHALEGRYEEPGVFNISRNATPLARAIVQTINNNLPADDQQKAQRVVLNWGYPRCELIQFGPLRWFETREHWYQRLHCCEPLRLSTLKQYQYGNIELSPREWLELISNSSELEVDEYLDDVRRRLCKKSDDECSSLEHCLPTNWLAGKASDLIEKCRDLDRIQAEVTGPVFIADNWQIRPSLVELAETLDLAQGLPWWQ